MTRQTFYPCCGLLLPGDPRPVKPCPQCGKLYEMPCRMVTVRMSSGLVEKLHAKADEQGVSLNTFCLSLLSAAVREPQPSAEILERSQADIEAGRTIPAAEALDRLT